MVWFIITVVMKSTFINFIDTHAHLDGEEYAEDRKEMIERAREAGVSKVFLPAIDLPSVDRVVAMSKEYPGYCYPMIGLHPEEVRADYKEVLVEMKQILDSSLASDTRFIAVGEVGLDYYWSREFADEQLDAFE